MVNLSCLLYWRPSFCRCSNGNYRLQPDSPCIDAGINAYAISDYDLDGNPRIVNYVLDIGVYEYQGLEGDLDGDGLQDTWEDTYFSGEADPNADADGDGLTNKEEHDGGTHPLQTDTDGDGIEDNVELSLIIPIRQLRIPTEMDWMTGKK